MWRINMIAKDKPLSLLGDLKIGEIEKKRVLVRVDFNVPLSEDLQVTDDTRIRSALDTIEYLLSHNCIVILMSHLGRPEGKIVEKLRMDPIALCLEKIIHRRIIKLDDCIGDYVTEIVSKLIPEILFYWKIYVFIKKKKITILFFPTISFFGRYLCR